MSKFNIQKELKESLIDAALLTTGLYAISWTASKIGVSKPSLAMSAENIAKVVIYLTAADMAKDYAKEQKIIPGV